MSHDCLCVLWEVTDVLGSVPGLMNLGTTTFRDAGKSADALGASAWELPSVIPSSGSPSTVARRALKVHLSSWRLGLSSVRWCGACTDPSLLWAREAGCRMPSVTSRNTSLRVSWTHRSRPSARVLEASVRGEGVSPCCASCGVSAWSLASPGSPKCGGQRCPECERHKSFGRPSLARRHEERVCSASPAPARSC